MSHSQSVDRDRGSLPETLTSFVGRRRELAGTRERMAESRLVTLTGPGGVGKTRLAIQVAAESRRAFRDGVWMVDLASLSDGSRVAQTILSALQVRDQSTRSAEEQLTEHLRDRQLLIVLDNCEHVIDACAKLVSALLRAAPGCRVLATSREPLGIDGERLFAVPPLSTPDPEHQRVPEALAHFEAVNLFVDRARSVQPEFAVTARNHKDVAEIVARLDGVPLAIELAAVRLRSLSLAEVLERLSDRFSLLTEGSRAAMPRQQTLRALVDWSYELCTADEQLLWSRLSVFAGTFDLRAAEGVCGGEGLRTQAVFEALDHLVAKSIVLTERSDERLRYRMLVTVREYGAELLAAAGETDELSRRHASYYRTRARSTVEHFCGPDQAAMIAQMREDHPNLRAALSWSLRDPAEARIGAALAADLRYLWIPGGALGEGRQWLDQVLEVTSRSTPERGQALWVAAWVALVQGDQIAALERLDEALELAHALGDRGVAAHAIQHRGLATLFAGDPAASIPFFEAAAAEHELAEHRIGLLWTLMQLTVARAYAGDLDAARQTCEQALELSARHGERWTRAYLLWASGIVAWRDGDLDRVRDAARSALALQRDFHDGFCSALSIELLAWVGSAEGGSSKLSARLFGAATAVWSELGTSMEVFGPSLNGDSVAASRQAEEALGSAQFKRQFEHSAAFSIDQAISFALDGAAHDAPVASEASPLSRREEEVAALIAEGMSNKAIAATLIVSPRTVDGHVERILSKLGVNSRTQVAAWIAERASRHSGTNG